MPATLPPSSEEVCARFGPVPLNETSSGGGVIGGSDGGNGGDDGGGGATRIARRCVMRPTCGVTEEMFTSSASAC